MVGNGRGKGGLGGEGTTTEITKTKRGRERGDAHRQTDTMGERGTVGRRKNSGRGQLAKDGKKRRPCTPRSFCLRQLCRSIALVLGPHPH